MPRDPELISELRQTLASLNMALDAVGEAIVWAGADGIVRWCNASFERLMNAPRLKILGKDLASLLPLKEEGVVLDEALHPVRLLQGGQTQVARHAWLADGDRQIFIAGTRVDTPVRDVVLVLTVRDLAGALESEQLRLQTAALRATANAIAILDLEGAIQWLNPAFVELTGMPEVELIGTNEGVCPDAAQEPELRAALKASMAAGRRWSGQIPGTRRNGEAYVRQQMVTPIQNAEGRVSHYVSVAQDITNQVEAQERLRTREAQVRTILETAADGIIIIDDRGIIQLLNDSALAIFGYEEGELVGSNVSRLMLPEHASRHDEYVRRFIDTGVRHVIGTGREVEGRRKDGATVPLELSVSEARVGDRVFFTGIVRDISERKQVEAEMGAARKEAERANRAKDRFLASMSHELRTPLNAIIGFAQVLLTSEHGELNDEQHEFSTRILDSGHHLLSLINDLLDLSKVEAESMEIVRTSVDVAALCTRAARQVQTLAEEKGVALEVRDTSAGQRINGDLDERRVTQVLYNLLSNAIKFTPEGGRVELSIRWHGRLLELAVTDTGRGLEPEHLEDVFKPFFQVSEADSMTQEGTGLGMAITAEIVALHGGHIWVESDGIGEGARFVVHLPDCLIDDQGSATSRQDWDTTDSTVLVPWIDGARILLADDSPDNQALIRAFLNPAGALVTCVDDGAAAAEAFSREPPDIVLMDIRMPVLDGLAATRRIRAWERTKGLSPTPVLALSANATTDDVAASVDAGCDAHLTKPISRSALLRALSEHLKSAALPPVAKALAEEFDPDILDLLPGYIANRHADVAAIDRALAQGDWETVETLGHRCKGSGGGYGLPEISVAGATLETAAQQRVTADARSGLEALLEALRDAEQRLGL